MAFRRFEPLKRFPLVFVEFNESRDRIVGWADVPRHLREQYGNVSLDDLHRFALAHNAKKRELYRDGRHAFRLRTGRYAAAKYHLAAREFDAYHAMPQLDAGAIRSVSRACSTLGEWLDRWRGNVEAGRVGEKLLFALYTQTNDPILGLLFQEEDVKKG